MHISNFCKAPLGQCSSENSLTWLGIFTFSNILVEMFSFLNLINIKGTCPSFLTFVALRVALRLPSADSPHPRGAEEHWD